MSGDIRVEEKYEVYPVDRGVISMNFVCTTENIADLLTKPLATVTHMHFTSYVTGKIQPKLRALRAKLTALNELRHRKL